MNPAEWQGERWWVVALYEPVVWEGSKVASLKRRIIAEVGASKDNLAPKET